MLLVRLWETTKHLAQTRPRQMFSRLLSPGPLPLIGNDPCWNDTESTAEFESHDRV